MEPEVWGAYLLGLSMTLLRRYTLLLIAVGLTCYALLAVGRYGSGSPLWFALSDLGDVVHVVTPHILGTTFVVGLLGALESETARLAWSACLLVVGVALAVLRTVFWYDAAMSMCDVGVRLVVTGSLYAVVPPLVGAAVLGWMLTAVTTWRPHPRHDLDD